MGSIIGQSMPHNTRSSVFMEPNYTYIMPVAAGDSRGKLFMVPIGDTLAYKRAYVNTANC